MWETIAFPQSHHTEDGGLETNLLVPLALCTTHELLIVVAAIIWSTYSETRNHPPGGHS